VSVVGFFVSERVDMLDGDFVVFGGAVIEEVDLECTLGDFGIQAGGAAKVGNAGIGGDTGTGQDNGGFSLPESLEELLCLLF
jgi:hypothetical protein